VRYDSNVRHSGVACHAPAFPKPVTLWGQLKFPKKLKSNRKKILAELFECLPGHHYTLDRLRPSASLYAWVGVNSKRYDFQSRGQPALRSTRGEPHRPRASPAVSEPVAGVGHFDHQHRLFPQKSRWPPRGILLHARSGVPSSGPPRQCAKSHAAPCQPAAAFESKSVNLASRRSTPAPFFFEKGSSVTSRPCVLARRRPASIHRFR
jgi:hypothetical protein